MFDRVSDTSLDLIMITSLNPLSANPQNGQTYLNNSSAFADKLLECVWSFCGAGAKKGYFFNHEIFLFALTYLFLLFVFV